MHVFEKVTSPRLNFLLVSYKKNSVSSEIRRELRNVRARETVRAIFRGSLDTFVLDVETTSTSAAFPIQLWIICAPGRPARGGVALH